MKAFFRVVLMSLRYKWSIAAAVVCSMIIALLWSASITTIYPFIEIVFKGETLHSWVDNEVAKAQGNVQKLEDEIVELEHLVAEGEDRLAPSRLAVRRDRLAAEQRAIDALVWIRPTVERWAPRDPFQTLMLVMGWLVAVTLIKGVCLVLSCQAVARVANRTVMDLRRTYYRKSLELDQKRIDQLGTSNMMTHLSHNMLMISGGLTMFYGKSLREPLKMFACLAVAAWISLPLLLISLCVMPLGIYAVHQVARRMKRATGREMEGMAAVFQTLIETFSAVKTVRIFNRERTERRRFKRNAASLYRMSMRMSFYDALLRPLSEMLGIISIALAILAGAYLVLNQTEYLFGIRVSSRPMEPTLLLMFYAMLAGASDPARKMSEIVTVLVRGGTASENLFRTYDVAPKIARPEDPCEVPLHRHSITFKRVNFTYLPRQPVLRHVSLTIPFGQCVAIVGGNGSGKSTLVNLLARFYDPNHGQIMIDGVDLKRVHPKKLRRQMAWVTQDPQLFRGTLWDNIAYGNPQATPEQISQAARLAHVEDFLPNLDKGYLTEVGDAGTRLSAGQRQRVALARALVADPSILILDEATSQMDGHTEAIVHESLRPFLRQRTTILITHRQSSIALADRVIVMDGGRIVSDTTPEEALKSSAAFQFLFSKSA